MVTGKKPEKVTIDFVRSPSFRAVHCNGVWGGLTPRQELSIIFFTERATPPLSVTHKVSPDGRLGPEIARKTTSDVQRECEVEVLMSMDDAVSIHKWLGQKIAEWRKVALSIPKSNSPEAS